MIKSALIAVFLLLVSHRVGCANDTLSIAAAANFIRPLEKLALVYSQQEAIQLNPSYGSSGKLYAQLLQGAPYDLFLSADQKRPALLSRQGICEEPFKYATGRVVLWSLQPLPTATTWQQALSIREGKIAIANPETAPYGQVPFQLLEDKKLLIQIQARLVFGQSVGQTFLFAHTEAATFGFIALSQALSPEGLKGQYWPLTESPSIPQWGCVVRGSTRLKASRHFQATLTGPEAQTLIHGFGYR